MCDAEGEQAKYSEYNKNNYCAKFLKNPISAAYQNQRIRQFQIGLQYKIVHSWTVHQGT